MNQQRHVPVCLPATCQLSNDPEFRVFSYRAQLDYRGLVGDYLPVLPDWLLTNQAIKSQGLEQLHSHLSIYCNIGVEPDDDLTHVPHRKPIPLLHTSEVTEARI
jgi:hypothetical protein